MKLLLRPSMSRSRRKLKKWLWLGATSVGATSAPNRVSCAAVRARERRAAHALGRVDTGQRNFGANRAALVEDPVDQVVVVSELGDRAHDEFDVGAAFVRRHGSREQLEMAPGRIAGQALEDADHLRQRQRDHRDRRIGNRRRDERIEQLRIRRHVEAEPERGGEQAESELAFVHVRAIEPVGIGVLVGDEDLRQRALVHHRPTVVGHERDHGAGTALEAHVELPLLPLDEVAGDREVRLPAAA